MVCGPADRDGLHVVRTGNAADVGPEFRADIVTDGVKAVFGGEDAMNELGDVGVAMISVVPAGP